MSSVVALGLLSSWRQSLTLHPDNLTVENHAELPGRKDKLSTQKGAIQDGRRCSRKDCKQLMKSRTTAKSGFTRKAKSLSKGADTMVEAQLREFAKLSDRLGTLLDANDDYRSGLMAEAQQSEKEVHRKQQEEDIEKTACVSEEKFEEVKGIVQRNLWSRYGQRVLTEAVREAEKACDQASNLPVQSINLEGYGVHLMLLAKRISEAIQVISAWERWILIEEREELDGRIKDLTRANNMLELRSLSLHVGARKKW